ncbi:hypothetical protein ANN_00179 [Periplaneta americana]|uniref:C-type lectin domain-containing protein n=1 Tax=Periplaneta americana TaxID=6978 RepID=A0ABQ8TSE8_PERAM|nr:hypothetical protein ANN_00179 [Periplaneta americana]
MFNLRDTEYLTVFAEHPRPFYELVPGLGYLKLHNRPKTWNEAKIACEKEGAHLGILNSETELEALRELRARLPSHYKDWRDNVVHVGVTDSQEEGTWLTIFGESWRELAAMRWLGRRTVPDLLCR